MLVARDYRFDKSTLGAREISRLISRLQHRKFGVLVTTSAIARQGYEEVGEDRHPTIFISGRDIAEKGGDVSGADKDHSLRRL